MYIDKQLSKLSKRSPAFAKKIDKQMGCLTIADVQKLIEIDRLHQVLVRCGNGRFVCAAQDVEHFMKCVEKGGDYVRDVSLVVDDWKPTK
jgi:hypothetical protein